MDLGSEREARARAFDMRSSGWITLKLEWQVFRNTENTEKSWKLSTKRKTWKITENNVFVTQKEEKIKKIIIFGIF